MTSTSERLLLLLSLLQSRRDWPGSVIADRMGISHRTVRRDVDRLRNMGYNIRATKGPDGGYHLDAGSELPPLLFDDDQVIALAVALQAATVSGVGVEEAAIRALTTVRQVMPARLRHRLNAIKFTALPTRSQGTVHPDVLVAVSSGIRSHEVLRFDYESSRERGESVDFPAPRRVEPHHLVSVGQRWYLVAWDLDRGDWRTFRADRITPRIPTGPRSTPREIPGGSVGAFVAARFVGADVGSHWPCQGTVILGMPASAVAPFAGDGTVEDLGEGRCRFESGSWSWIALAASLGRFDANIEVVGPPELAAAFQQLATRYATAASSLPRRDH